MSTMTIDMLKSPAMEKKPTPKKPARAKTSPFADIHAVLDELSVKHKEAMARLDKEAAERKAADKAFRQQLGYETQAIGEELENAVVDALKTSRKLCGIAIDNIHRGMESENPPCEFDVVVVNGKYVIVIEVKRQLTLEDVQDFTNRRIPNFSEAFPQMARGKKILGAMAFSRTEKNGRAVAAALKEGFFVLSIKGDKKLRQIKSAKEITDITTHPQTPAKKRAVKK